MTRVFQVLASWRSLLSGDSRAPFRSEWPMEAAGSMENACGVSHSPLDGASGADHSYHRPDGYGDTIHNFNCLWNRGSSKPPARTWQIWAGLRCAPATHVGNSLCRSMSPVGRPHRRSAA